MHNKMFIFCQIVKIIYVLIKLSSFILYSEQNDMGKLI
jgi:tryptophan-rich sensory protein